MDLLTRGEILSNNKRRRMSVEIGDYGAIRIRSLTMFEQSRLEHKAAGLSNTEIKQLLLCATMEDEAEQLLFSIDDASGGVFDEVDSLFLNLAYRAASLFTGFAAESDQTAAIEEAVKNYSATQSNGSPVSA